MPPPALEATKATNSPTAAAAVAAAATTPSGTHHNHDPHAPVSSALLHNIPHDIAQDPQVAEILTHQPFRSLLDAVTDEMLGNRRHPERPILSRIVLVGEIVSKDDPTRTFFDEVINTAVQAVNAQDPTGGKTSGGETVGVTGMYVEMTTHFFQMLESEPAHLLQVCKEVAQRVYARKSFEGIKKIHVALYSDDIVSRSCPKWCALEANPMQALPENVPLEEMIVDATQGLMTIGQQLLTQGKMQVDSMLANAKTTQAHLLPKPALVDKIMDSGLCLTLEEFLYVYGQPTVSVTRPSELVHPFEPPLFYEVS